MMMANDRITDLARTAAGGMLSYSEDSGFVLSEKETIRFAELIIEECASVARVHNLKTADRSHMIHKAIKQHFGVE